MRINIKRVYDEPSESDGARVLVDRLWPRVVTKERAALDQWAKDLAPSNALRQAFGHKEGNIKSFSRQYAKELRKRTEAVESFLSKIDRRQRLTLLYAAKDPEVNHAIVLKNVLEKWSKAHGYTRTRCA